MMRSLDKLRMLARLASDMGQPKIFSFHDSLPDVFSRYIELLIYKRYKILGADELHDRLTGTRAHKEVVLTFDDGRRNFWTVIFPLLKKYRIPAILFVIPERLGTGREYFPNLDDYWKGRASWEALYSSHRRQPYLTWQELEAMHATGLVHVASHGLRHDVVCVSRRVIDFQHPGVYEMPVYFDEWVASGTPLTDGIWGVPVYERAWSPLAQNIYVPDPGIDILMNRFVKDNGGFFFFKRKNWRRKLFDYHVLHRHEAVAGLFKKNQSAEEERTSVVDSRRQIQERLRSSCLYFSLPLYQSSPRTLDFADEAGYKAVFTGPWTPSSKQAPVPCLNRIPGFWLQFLAYL